MSVVDYLVSVTAELKKKYDCERANGVIQLRFENKNIDFNQFNRAVLSVTGETVIEYLEENGIVEKDDKKQVEYVVDILKQRYIGEKAKSLNEVYTDNNDLWLSGFNTLTKSAFFLSAKKYLVEKNIIEEEEKRRIDIEESLAQVITSLKEIYKECRATSLTEVAQNNSNISCTYLNSWARSLYNMTAKELLVKEGIIVNEVLTENKTIKQNLENNMNNKVSIKQGQEDISFDNSDKKKSFGEICKINVADIEEQELPMHHFSVRTQHCLTSNKINTNVELLNANVEKLENIRGFGKKCMGEISTFFFEFKDNQSLVDIHKNRTLILKRLRNYKEYIINERFSELEGFFNTSDEIKIIEELKMSFELFNREMIVNLINQPDDIAKLSLTVKSISAEIDNEKYIRKQLEELDFPHERWLLFASPFINAYTKKENQKERLCALFNDVDSKIKDIKLNGRNDSKLGLEFLSWCKFDIQSDILELFNEKHFADERILYVITERANAVTLREIGDSLDVTRERIRQIEKKAIRYFTRWNGKMRVLAKISALRNDDKILTPVELKEYFKENTPLFLYLLKNSDSIDYKYDNQLDVFVVGVENLSDSVIRFVDDMPSRFKMSELSNILSDAEAQCIPEELLLTAINKEYVKSGSTYHRDRLSLTSMYMSVIKEYFPRGIHAYDDSEIIELKDKIIDNYGYVDLPINNRAIGIRIADIGILCERGTYKISDGSEITSELLFSIQKYIQENPNGIIPLSSIYSSFEEELLEEGIDNKYFLYGILKKHSANKYIFKRDYLFKEGSNESFYLDIIDYIKKYDYPIDKEVIKQKYPGLTDAVISLATSQEKIVNYFGSYLHADKLRLFSEDKEYLFHFLDVILQDHDAHHGKDIYNYFLLDNKVLLNRIFVNSPFSMFSVLEYLFDEKFQFKRPYIAKNDVIIEYASERLEEYILENGEIDISDIMEFARENHIHIPSILDFINSLNETHLMKNKREIISINKIGVTEKKYVEIEEMLKNEVVKSQPITQLKCIFGFPSLNIPWDEWLIYSLLNKYSEIFSVAASNSELRKSIPIIAPKGEMQIANIEVDLDEHIVQVDDLENIDELISNYINVDVEGV